MSDGLVNVLLIISATLIFLMPLLSLISIFFNYKNWYLYLGLLLSLYLFYWYCIFLIILRYHFID